MVWWKWSDGIETVKKNEFLRFRAGRITVESLLCRVVHSTETCAHWRDRPLWLVELSCSVVLFMIYILRVR